MKEETEIEGKVRDPTAAFSGGGPNIGGEVQLCCISSVRGFHPGQIGSLEGHLAINIEN